MKNNTTLVAFNSIHTVVVHSGIFHLDDVLFVALAQLARQYQGLEPLEISRVREVAPDQTLQNGYLVGDIGNGAYDHHDPFNQKARENGSLLAAAGLLFRDIWRILGLTEEGYATIDKEIVEPSDLQDSTGKGGNELSRLIKGLNPNWNETVNADDRFKQAVSIVCALVGAQLTRVRANAEIEAEATNALLNKEGHVVVLPKFCPIANDIRIKDDPDILFVLFPSLRGGWQATAIKKEDGSSKKLFPRQYWGTPCTEQGMTFCHKAGFTATFDSLESAKRFINSQEWDA